MWRASMTANGTHSLREGWQRPRGGGGRAAAVTSIASSGDLIASSGPIEACEGCLSLSSAVPRAAMSAGGAVGASQEAYRAASLKQPDAAHTCSAVNLG